VWSSLMHSHPMYLFVCAMNASDQWCIMISSPIHELPLDTTLQMIKHVSKFCQVMLVYRYVQRKERQCCDMLHEIPTKAKKR
jgi:hypothetical protein